MDLLRSLLAVPGLVAGAVPGPLRPLAALPGSIAAPVTEPVRAALAAPLQQTFGERTLFVDQPPGDPGLFGPGSVVWRVHADAPAMLIGGISALLLQTLHPGAMAGVADHSNYRDDPLGRLRRTGVYVAGTTFGGMDTVDELVAQVQRVHRKVRGTRPDGVPYSAVDPELLTWIHVAEVGQFLRGYQAYGARPLRRPEVDRYFQEVAEVGRRLGAEDVPESAAEVRAYYRALQPELTFGDQARDARSFLLEPKGASDVERRVYDLIVQAAIAILPGWSRRQLRLRQPRVVREAVRPAAVALAAALRWALGESPLVAEATARVEATTSSGAPLGS